MSYEIKYDFNDAENGWFTHLPLLRHIFEAEKMIDRGSNILELGCGFGSSKFFSHFQKELGLNVFSFETNPEWFEKIRDEYGNENYNFTLLENWDQLEQQQVIRDNLFDFIFIDQKGGCKMFNEAKGARIYSALLLKDKGKIICLHDYDHYILRRKELHQKINDTFEFKKLYVLKINNINHPQSYLVSNLVNVDFEGINWLGKTL